MPDIDHIWGSDINVSPSGDLALIDGTQLGIERIIRRLMTRGAQTAQVNQPALVGEYIWHPDYGGSIPQRIGGAIDVNLIKAVIRRQMFKESVVARNPPPIINVGANALGYVSVSIAYNDAVTGQQKQFSFDLNQ